MVTPDLVQVSTFLRRSTFVLQRGSSPQIDLTTVHTHNHSSLSTKAIYQLDGDTLTYCVGSPGQPRPTTFATQADDGNTLVVLRRARR